VLRRHDPDRGDAAVNEAAIRVLLVDDEPQIVRAVRTLLQGVGYTVETAATGEDALVSAAVKPPDAVILDLVLPDRSGSDVCRELRTWLDAPILVLSVIGDEAEKVAALDAGADDYVTKPFGKDELLARLRAVLRRSLPAGGPILRLDSLEVDLANHAVRIDGRRIQLTPTEFKILSLLARNPGKLLTHTAILRDVWGPGYGEETHYLRVYISHLRHKIEADPARPRYIVTEPGAGYRLVDPATEAEV
jgi:two-component system KDP operon response regulator KdpE